MSGVKKLKILDILGQLIWPNLAGSFQVTLTQVCGRHNSAGSELSSVSWVPKPERTLSLHQTHVIKLSSHPHSLSFQTHQELSGAAEVLTLRDW